MTNPPSSKATEDAYHLLPEDAGGAQPRWAALWDEKRDSTVAATLCLMATGTEIRYAKSGDVHVAYQIVGDGPRNLVFVPGFVSNLEVQWELPGFSRFIHRQGGPMSILFAATHPSRVDGLVLYGSYARRPVPAGGWESLLCAVEDRWGTGELFSARAQSAIGDEHLRLLHAHLERQSASPGGAAAILRMAAEIDVSGILPAVAVPTLVLHRSGDPVLPSTGGRDLAAGIPNARFVELPGVDHIVRMGDGDDIVGEIEEFMTGERRAPDGDHVLATVLFTDIVDSTGRAAELGDRRWRDLLDSHDALARHAVERFRGRVIKTTGDGLLATFDGPARGIRSACAIRDGLRRLGVEMRAGLHTGEIEVRGADIGGIAVHVAQRVAATSGSGEVVVSSTVKPRRRSRRAPSP